MKLTRRGLLLGGLGGAALLTAGGVGLAMRGTVHREPRRSLKVLSPAAFSILASVADTIHPPGDGWPSAWDLEVPENVDEALSALHPNDVADLEMLLGLLENALAGLVLDGRVTTFTGSSLETRTAVLESWAVSEVEVKRMGYIALKGLCSAAFWGNPASYALCGYPGPPDYSSVVPKRILDAQATEGEDTGDLP